MGSKLCNGDALTTCLRFLLRPVIRFCVRHSIKLQDLVEISKNLFVEAAAESIEDANVESSVSRLSIMTGVHRKDVARMQQAQPQPAKKKDIIARIIGQWQHDPRFTTKSGGPRVLGCEGAESEFAELVASVSRELNPYTVLFEMERIEAVSKSKHKLKLVSRMFIPKGDIEEGFRLLGEDAEDLLVAVEENVLESPNVPNLHIKTEYDNIPASSAEEIREWFLKEGSVFHQRARNYLSQYDRDINPEAKRPGKAIRVALGAFSVIQSPEWDGRKKKRRTKK